MKLHLLPLFALLGKLDVLSNVELSMLLLADGGRGLRASSFSVPGDLSRSFFLVVFFRDFCFFFRVFDEILLRSFSEFAGDGAGDILRIIFLICCVR